jgi:hypothetical protein
MPSLRIDTHPRLTFDFDSVLRDKADKKKNIYSSNTVCLSPPNSCELHQDIGRHPTLKFDFDSVLRHIPTQGKESISLDFISELGPSSSNPFIFSLQAVSRDAIALSYAKVGAADASSLPSTSLGHLNPAKKRLLPHLMPITLTNRGTKTLYSNAASKVPLSFSNPFLCQPQVEAPFLTWNAFL